MSQPTLVKVILDSIYNSLNKQGHIANPPIKVNLLSTAETSGVGENNAYIFEHVPSQFIIKVWIEGDRIFFQDEEITWPINDPSVDLELVALAIFENPTELHRVATETQSSRRIKIMADQIQKRADTLTEALDKFCAEAAAELYASFKDDPNVQMVGYTNGAPVLKLIIYTKRKPKPGEYPKLFKTYEVEVKRIGKMAPAQV